MTLTEPSTLSHPTGASLVKREGLGKTSGTEGGGKREGIPSRDISFLLVLRKKGRGDSTPREGN